MPKMQCNAGIKIMHDTKKTTQTRNKCRSIYYIHILYKVGARVKKRNKKRNAGIKVCNDYNLQQCIISTIYI